MASSTCLDPCHAALDFLVSRIDYERSATVPYGERQFKLDRMRELLARLGHPETGLAIVHVAGTKGKGSTSAMIAAALSANGLRTGLYTSPHLDRVEERIAIDGLACSGDELAGLVDRVRPVVEALDTEAAGQGTTGPTYFEVTTALALLRFVQAGVDAAVLEVGMGGRLDSTNVCLPRVSVITSISYDHTRQLGSTLAQIAREKAGIIKPGVPVVSGALADEPRAVIAAIAAERGSPLVELGRDFEFNYRPPRAVDRVATCGEIDFRYRVPGREAELRAVPLGLLGRHQGANAAVALATLAELRAQGWPLAEAATRRGLAELRWPARVEVVRRQPTVIIDAAHNVASVAALVEVLEESFLARPRTLIFATTREKDVAGMLRLLLPQFDRIVLTRYRSNPRGVPPEDLEALARQLSERALTVCPDPTAAWDEARSQTPADGLVCVTGSFFIAAEIRTQVGGSM